MLKKHLYIFIITVTIFNFKSFSQEENLNLKIKDTVFTNYVYNPLSPAKAAFYSAVLPGLGQAYNKKYWKIPIVYGGLATGIYFYTTNNKEYNRYRDAYKSRLAGLTTDEFYTVNSSGILVERVTLF